jgi:hypothetical protein
MLKTAIKVELFFTIAACVASIFAMVNSRLKNLIFRHFVAQGAKFGLAAPRISALLFGGTSILLISDISHNSSEKLLVLIAMCIFLAAFFIALFEYRRSVRSN